MSIYDEPFSENAALVFVVFSGTLIVLALKPIISVFSDRTYPSEFRSTSLTAASLQHTSERATTFMASAFSLKYVTTPA